MLHDDDAAALFSDSSGCSFLGHLRRVRTESAPAEDDPGYEGHDGKVFEMIDT